MITDFKIFEKNVEIGYFVTIKPTDIVNDDDIGVVQRIEDQRVWIKFPTVDLDWFDFRLSDITNSAETMGEMKELLRIKKQTLRQQRFDL